MTENASPLSKVPDLIYEPKWSLDHVEWTRDGVPITDVVRVMQTRIAHETRRHSQ